MWQIFALIKNIHLKFIAEFRLNKLSEIDPEERDIYLIYKFLLAVRQNTLRGISTPRRWVKKC